MTSDMVLHLSIDSEVTAEATRVLEELGMNVTEAVDLLLTRLADEKRLPFTPNPETIAAIEAARRGEGVSFTSIEALMADLNADD